MIQTNNNLTYYNNIKTMYNTCKYTTLKTNLIHVLKRHNITPKRLQTIFPDLSKHTIFSYYKPILNNPDLINLIILAEYLEIDVREFLKR